MSPAERWKRVRQLCDRLEREPAEVRFTRLEQDEGDPSIRQEVLRMLDALQAEPHAALKASTSAEPTRDLPTHIGPYQVEAKIGRGGTGTVYAASIDRGGVAHPVAVKVLHSFLDEDAARRFRREQELLVRLDHPGITRIHDGGITAQGQPYLVMERVEGVPLGSYCRDHRLDLAARIRLVIEVCQAVYAAHRSLIVHLDLKPSNILVTNSGQVKLLDFGAAKLLDPTGSLTTTRALTPMYASPEQLRGESVTTACDVYSLGLILFELLTGGWPYASRASLVALSERASGDTTTRPMADAATPESAERMGLTINGLRGHLRGDLEVIVRKAMAAEPAHRYDSVFGLAEDLERYLTGRPVLAQRQTTLYRLRKYAARNAGAVTVTALAFVALAIAAAYAWQQQQQKLEAARRADSTAQFLGSLFASSNPLYGGRPGMTVLELVDLAERRIQRGDIEDRGLAATLQMTMGNLAYQSGQPGKGEAMIRSGSAAARASGDANAGLVSLLMLAQIEISAGKCDAVAGHLKQADDIVAALKLEPAKRVSYWMAKAQAADACEKKLDAAVDYARQAANAVRPVPDRSIEGFTPAYIGKALVMNGLGLMLHRKRNFTEARKAVDEGLRHASAGPDGGSAKVALYRTLAAIEYGQGDAAASARALGEGVKLMEGVTGPFEYHRMKVMWAARRGESGDKAGGAELIRQTLPEVRKRQAEIGPQLWMILVDSAFGLYRCGECAEVPALVREVDSLTGGNMPPQWKGNRYAAEALCLAQQGKMSEARGVARQAMMQLEVYLQPNAPLRKRLEAIAQ